MMETIYEMPAIAELHVAYISLDDIINSMMPVFFLLLQAH